MDTAKGVSYQPNAYVLGEQVYKKANETRIKAMAAVTYGRQI